MIAVAVLHSDFSNADFSDSNLSLHVNTGELTVDNPTYFENTNLSGSIFASAEMRWIHLSFSTYQYADLTDAILTGAILVKEDCYANLGQFRTLAYPHYNTSAMFTIAFCTKC